MTHFTRGDWGARPPKAGPGHLDPAAVKGVAFHHHGGDPIHGKAHVIRALQSWQRFHQDTRGWSDIAYQVAVDQDGNTWELRGLVNQSAANGDRAVNQSHGAVLLIVGNDEDPTDKLLAAARGVVASFRQRYPRGRAIKGHQDIRPGGGTECPGPKIMTLIRSGQLEPNGKEVDDMPAPEDLWNVPEDKWQPGDTKPHDQMPVRQQLNQARGYAEHASKTADKLERKVEALTELVRQLLARAVPDPSASPRRSAGESEDGA